MRHEGPDPGEALPVGEKPLQPAELDKLAAFMLGTEDLAFARRAPHEVPLRLQGAQAMMTALLIDVLKTDLIVRRGCK